MTTPTPLDERSLPDQLRALVDQVEVPTLAELRTHAARSRPRVVRSHFAVAFAAVLLVVALGAGAVMLLRADEPARRTGPATTADPPAECIVVAETGPGCDMAPGDAARYLGFDVHEPSGLPDGWVPAAAVLRVYSRDGLPPGIDRIALYLRYWAPPGTDVTALPDCANYVLVRERTALPGEDPSVAGAPFPLGDGITAYGQEPLDGCGSETTGYQGEVTWIRGDRSIVVVGHGVGADQFLAIARSVDR